ncbi:MAG: response regulator [Bacteroidota bacterium]
MDDRIYHIMIVDDEQENIDIVRRKLLHAPYRCSSETDTEKAYDAVVKSIPDLIVMDWQMPGKSGIEMVQRFKLDERCAKIPVIIMTGMMKESVHLQEAFDAGASDYIRKPVDTLELRSRIAAILELRAEQNQRLMLEQELHAQQQRHLQTEIERKKNELSEMTVQLVSNNRLADTFIKTLEKMIDGSYGKLTRSEIDHQVTLFKKELFKLQWSTIEEKFIGNNHIFKMELMKRHPDLTVNDVKLAILYHLKMSNKEISEITFISYEGVRKARTRLRKKLDLDSSIDLTEYLCDLG